jgi:hypothetical protein
VRQAAHPVAHAFVSRHKAVSKEHGFSIRAHSGQTKTEIHDGGQSIPQYFAPHFCGGLSTLERNALHELFSHTVTGMQIVLQCLPICLFVHTSASARLHAVQLRPACIVSKQVYEEVGINFQQI